MEPIRGWIRGWLLCKSRAGFDAPVRLGFSGPAQAFSQTGGRICHLAQPARSVCSYALSKYGMGCMAAPGTRWRRGSFARMSRWRRGRLCWLTLAHMVQAQSSANLRMAARRQTFLSHGKLLFLRIHIQASGVSLLPHSHNI